MWTIVHQNQNFRTYGKFQFQFWNFRIRKMKEFPYTEKCCFSVYGNPRIGVHCTLMNKYIFLDWKTYKRKNLFGLCPLESVGPACNRFNDAVGMPFAVAQLTLERIGPTYWPIGPTCRQNASYAVGSNIFFFLFKVSSYKLNKLRLIVYYLAFSIKKK